MKVDFTNSRRSELFEANYAVNKNTKYTTDKENYGVDEYWEVAKGKGDCEDYALAKMKMLRDKGWPKESLDIAICKDDKGVGHAVLVAHTSDGDYILDNNLETPTLWNKLPQYNWMQVSVGGNFKEWRQIT